MTEIATLIEGLGFPAVCVLGLAFHLNKKDRERAEMDKEREKMAYEDRMKLIQSIEHYRVSSNQLLETNKEMSETNRLLANSINAKVDNIENDVLEIKTKLKAA